jgi:hypothetical protein
VLEEPKAGTGLYYCSLMTFCDHAINQLCEKPAGLSPKTSEYLQRMLEECARVLRVRSLTKTERSELLARRQATQQRLDGLHKLVEGMQRDKTASKDELLSRMSALRFDGQMKARRQRALARRVVANTAQHDGADLATQLQALALEQAQRPDARSDLTPEADQFFSCTLSCSRLSELMSEDTDNVLGFGLSIRRPEAMVDAPSLVHIDKVRSCRQTQGGYRPRPSNTHTHSRTPSFFALNRSA